MGKGNEGEAVLPTTCEEELTMEKETGNETMPRPCLGVV